MDRQWIVMIQCPNTGKCIRTGLQMDGDSWVKFDAGVMRKTCPECGEAHEWGKEDAFLNGLREE